MSLPMTSTLKRLAEANRCHCILLAWRCRKSTPVGAVYTFGLFCPNRGGAKSLTWQQSANATEAIGFLDLPRELRDMIYNCLCDSMNRTGAVWETTRLEPAGTYTNFQPLSQYEPIQPSYPKHASCAIMSTCHQVHAEFATTFYGRPFQFDATPDTIKLCLAPSYAHLVRDFLFIESSTHADPKVITRYILQVATGLTNMFPNLRCLRVAFKGDWYQVYVDAQWSSYSLQSGNSKTRAEHIAAAKDATHSFLVEQGIQNIPVQLEVVELTLS
ncbi:hypothetical protein CC86DRAFT_454247 [Ophiobolus disseminans]|uniref:Uncharacterized protein n=1 Tax=Ophiobolus disseminans TaxID=1469910 RepID=A0A6A7A5L5_9PLEO|nr:hypothetical protein CC86DRAFT_454247 [Ophiobolus disseminans]